MGDKILIITEANEMVATGHLYESAELAKHLIGNGQTAVVLVNDDAEPELKAKLPAYIEYSGNIDKGYSTISEMVSKGVYSVVVTDLREISNEWIHRFKSEHDVPLICIDEWGHRRLDCDLIINPMIDPYYWEYEGTEAKLYCGHEYLILPSALQEYHKREKVINDRIERICVSMGGVDREGTTLKILNWIMDESERLRGTEWDIIVGAGFKYKEELQTILENIKKDTGTGEENIVIHNNPDNIYELFYKADLAFCAGGNTLHELACIGTPAIVIPTAPHEKRNGMAFQECGFGVCLKESWNVNADEIWDAFMSIQEHSIRIEMSVQGKNMVDGNGDKRTGRYLMKAMGYF